MKLNLGCGSDVRPGWVNIDAARVTRGQRERDECFVEHDLSRGVPFGDGSCSLVYSSHFWEHLPPDVAIYLFYESNRVLVPGGRFRIALPDGIRLLKAWMEGDEVYLSALRDPGRLMMALPGRPNDIDFLNYCIFQWYEHRMIYDASKVIDCLEHVGFCDARQVAFDPAVDIVDPIRAKYSFYVEAEKRPGL